MDQAGAAEWAIDEIGSDPRSDSILVQEVRRSSVRRGGPSHRVGVRILDVVVHNNRRLFGEAAVRIDALVVHGGTTGGKLADLYAPGTFRFDRVADGDRLPIGESGLLVFLGRPRFFLDVFIAVSRDRENSGSLESLLATLASSKDALAAEGYLLSMATGVPDPGLLSAALKAALTIGDAALVSLRKATSATIGLYRNSWLRDHDGWGVGRHPAEGLFRAKDLSFSFEIVEEPR
jgi:hypothetical protein